MLKNLDTTFNHNEKKKIEVSPSFTNLYGTLSALIGSLEIFIYF